MSNFTDLEQSRIILDGHELYDAFHDFEDREGNPVIVLVYKPDFTPVPHQLTVIDTFSKRGKHQNRRYVHDWSVSLNEAISRY